VHEVTLERERIEKRLRLRHGAAEDRLDDLAELRRMRGRRNTPAGPICPSRPTCPMIPRYAIALCGSST